MGVSIDQFVQNLTDSGLMSADEVAAFRQSLPNATADGETMAKLLVRQRKLTKYQATAVYQGKIKHLMFGEYVVTDKIGAGGMGLVLKAEHRRMKRTVAIKVLPTQRLKDSDAIERFYREVEAAARLIHTNIVTSFDAGEHEGLHFLVMEYVNGQDLASIIHERGRLPVEQAVECIRQAAQGLQYAHDEGIVHRDIKPGNLLLDKKGTVKILDMGLARLNVGGLGEGEEKQPEQLTQSGQIMGTVDYMAPEQAEDTRTADHRADIYALGCTLFRLVTGEPVYQRDTIMQKLLAHREDAIPSMLEYRNDVPTRLPGIFQRMVAKNPDERYQSMTEVIAALDTAFIPSPQAAKPAPKKAESSSSMALTQFFQHIGEQKVATKPQTTAVPEETIDRAPSAEDTGDSIQDVEPVGWTPPAKSRNRFPNKLAGVAQQTKIWIAAGGALLAIVLIVVGAVALFSPSDTKTPGQSSDSTAGTPPMAKAPFGKDAARKYQEAWADYLGLPVENEITLPGGEKLTLVLIPPGEFMMGSTVEEQAKFLKEAEAANDTWVIEQIPSEGPQHRVRITQPFYLGKYEVTQAQWQSVMKTDPSSFKGNPSRPVEQVSWDDIQPFLAKLNMSPSADQVTFALPTEAQWEYACRAGTTSPYYGGENENDLLECGWYYANTDGKTDPVGKLRPNAFGLYDMHGDVCEWCADWFARGYYAMAPVDNPTGPTEGSQRVNRGGGWTQTPRHCRSAIRLSYRPGICHRNLGFRLAASIDVAAVLASKAKQTNSIPPLAKAPFGEQKAKEYQMAWADYLSVDVEREIELPGGETLTMVLIPPGEFMMGSRDEEQAKFLEEANKAADDNWSIFRIPSEGPQHRVRITRPFYLGKYEVTQAQWQAVIGGNSSQFKNNPSNPLETVTWGGTQQFLVKLNESNPTEQVTFALPTEAQWEYACRAGTTSYWYGTDIEDNLRQFGWFKRNSRSKTCSVGERQPNAFGLHDMHGNVWEWCADWFSADYYAHARVDDPPGPSAGTHRVYRGGSWRTHPWNCSSAHRNHFPPGSRTDDLGFRLAAAIVDAPSVVVPAEKD